MSKIFELGHGAECQLRNDNEFFELQSCGNHLFAELGEIVSASSADLFDESVEA